MSFVPDLVTTLMFAPAAWPNSAEVMLVSDLEFLNGID